MIDGHKLILHLNDWWYSSFGYEETEESKAIKKVIDEVEKYVEHTADRKTEPTISKMEQVEDETRLTAKCLNCANGEGDIEACGYCRHGDLYEPKDEPQTDVYDYKGNGKWERSE